MDETNMIQDSAPPGSIHQDHRVPVEWRRSILAFSALVLLLVIAYADTFASMVYTWWRSETFAHGFIILPISLYLVWRRRSLLLNLVPRVMPVSLILLLILSLLWLTARLAEVLLIQQLAVVTMLPVLVLLIFGWDVFRALLFPLLYLYFMVPFGEFLIPRLQDITAYIAVRALQLSGIPVFWEGWYFAIPTGSFEVAEACSGIRYLIASLSLGTLYSYLIYTKTWKRIVFIILSVIVPLVANGLRAYVIVIIAHLSDFRLATGIDHIVYGWLFFGIVITLLFWIGSIFKDDEISSVANAVNVNTNRESDQPDHSRMKYMLRSLILSFIGSLILLISAPISSHVLITSSENYSIRIVLPERINDYVYMKDIAVPTWAPEDSGAEVRIARRYQSEHSTIDVYVAAYGRQTQGKEMVKMNGRFISKPWVKTYENLSDYDENLSIREVWGKNLGHEIKLYQTFYVEGHLTARPISAKLLEIWHALRRKPVISALIMFSISGGEKSDQVDELLAPKIMTAIQESIRAKSVIYENS